MSATSHGNDASARSTFGNRRTIAEAAASLSCSRLSHTVRGRGYGKRVASMLSRLLLAASIMGAGSAYATTSSIPSFESLHLESWSPKNDFRQVAEINAKGGSAIGFNEEFIWGYLQDQNVKCDDCAGNSPPIPINVAESYLDVLANHGVSVAREIVPERFLDDPAKYAAIKTVLKQYQKRRFTLILVVGWPTTHAMGACYGFGGDGGAADRASYEYSVAVAKLLLYLEDQPDIDRNWLANHILVEPWNEFDALCKSSAGSPEKAARYQAIMQIIFDQTKISNKILMPSIVNVYNGFTTKPKGKYGKITSYIKEYYDNGGSGQPNIHLYYDTHWSKTPNDLSNTLGSEIAGIAQAAPSFYRKNLMIGETGVVTTSENIRCNNNSINDDNKDILYKEILENSAVNSNVSIILFWRLFGLENLTKNPEDCDQFFGITSNSWPGVKNSNEALQTIDKTGRDLLSLINKRR